MKTTAKLNENTLKVLNEIQTGKIFFVRFKKSDGSIRNMTCRKGVKKGLKGGTRKYKPSNYNLISVFDMDKREYRCFKLHNVIKLSINKTVYSC